MEKTPVEEMTGVVFETSASCQLACSFCFLRSYDERPKPEVMPLDLVEKTAPQLGGLQSVDLTGWGEPFKNPELLPIVKTIRRHFSGKLTMTTNGLLLDAERMEWMIEHGLDTVCVSVDAASERSYAKARPGGSFSRLKSLLEQFVSLRDLRGAKKPAIFATFLLRRDALAELPDFVGMASAHGLDGVVLQQLTGVFNEEGLAQATHSAYYGNDFEQATLELAVSKARRIAPPGFIMVGPEVIGAERTGDCGGFDLSRPFITAAGDVSVCCAMAYPCRLARRDGAAERTGQYLFGNVGEKTLAEIWQDPRYREAREQIASGGIPDACGDCIALYMKQGEVWVAEE